MTVALVSGACSDLILKRRPAEAVSDTTPDAAPRPTGRRVRSDSGRLKADVVEKSFSDIRRSLRRLVLAEETFFAENGTYTEELSLIGLTPDKDVTVRFLWLSRDGWAASGTHSALPGRDCVVFVGKAQAAPTTLKYLRRGREGVTVCDQPSPPPEPVASRPASPMPEARDDTASALDVLNPTVAMKVDLRNLVHSQEIYFATQGIYARRTETLALQYLWHRDVRVKILAADAQSWAAKATHARFPGKSCVIWFGSITQRPVTDAQGRQGDRSGLPVCDE
jgi:hypothetical protein